MIPSATALMSEPSRDSPIARALSRNSRDVLEEEEVGGRGDGVRRFDGERTDALKNRRDGRERTVGDVRRVGGVLHVEVRGVETGRLILQVDRDRETRRIVSGGRDPETAGKLVDQLAQGRLVPVQVE
jgi:hypothetical protein